MIQSICVTRVARLLSRAGSKLALCGFCCAAYCVLAGNAFGQLTTQALIGDSVSEIGTRYADVDEAIKRFVNRDIVGARLLLDSARRKDPTLPPTDMLVAKMYLLANNVNGARSELEKAAAASPADPEPLLVLGELALGQNRIIEAGALFDKALELTEKFSENPKRKRNFEIRGRMGRASVAERRKNWPAAAADMQALLKVDPENAMGHYRLGQALFMQKKFKEGYDELVAGQKIDKKLPNPYVAAALYYDQLEMANEAQQAFDRAIKANPNDATTLTQYGQWLIKTGKLDRAEQVLAEARKSNPQDLNILLLSGIAARMNKKMKPAEDYLMEALRLAPAQVNVLNQLALVLIEQNEDEKRNRALQFALISARINNESADAQTTLAWILYQLGRGGEAQAALQSAAQLGGVLSPDSNYLVAKIMADQKREDAAKQLVKESLDQDYGGIFVHRQEAQALLDTLNK